jgi:septation ring formation regulator EzrA
LEELLQYVEYAQKKLKEVKASISVVEQGKEVTKISIVWVRSQMEDHKNMLHDAKQQLDVFVTKLKDLGDGDSTKVKA